MKVNVIINSVQSKFPVILVSIPPTPTEDTARNPFSRFLNQTPDKLILWLPTYTHTVGTPHQHPQQSIERKTRAN
jgi:hypothetical protein